MRQETGSQLQSYLGLLLRRKKLIITCFLLAVVAGLVIYLKTPKVYQSSSLLIYQSRTMSPTKQTLDTQARIRDMVNTVSQQVTSRKSLEDLINQYDLYPDLRKQLPMADVVAAMQKDIVTELKEGDVFRVSFTGPAPKQVMQITNALAARFIEENLRFRGELASETSVYVKDELQMAKEALDKKEAVMRDYKLTYYNEMPQQLQVNMTHLASLQTQYQKNQDSIQDLEKTRLLIQEQIALRREVLDQQTARLRAEAGNLAGQNQATANAGGVRDVERLRQELTALKARYTPDHPEVKRQEKLLQSMLENQGPGKTAEGPGKDPQIDQLQLQLRDMQFSIARLQNDRQEILTQIKQCKQWIEAAPVREAEWSALTRDYEQLSTHYQGLVGQKIQAESTESLERRQQGTQFKIIDPARLPTKPFKPDFQKIMLMAMAIGMSCGIGLAFALESLDTSFKDPADLEATLGLPVTCSIPVLPTQKEQRRKKLIAACWSTAFLVTMVFLLGGMAYLWKTGAIII